MARHKDLNWNLREGTPQEDGSRAHSIKSIQAALLMDLRDELKRLNALLHCGNFVRIPSILDRIDKNTSKAKRGRPRKQTT